MKKIYDSLHLPPEIWRKMLLVMKLKIVLLLCCTGSLSASVLYSQQTKFDVNYEKQTIISVLDDLNARTGYQFFFRKNLIPENATTSVSLKEASLEEILDKVLVGNGYEYTTRGDVVLVNKASRVQTQPQVQVRGKVVDGEGKPIAGVAVVIKATSTGVTSDSEGRFTISASPGDVLSFTFLGMVPLEIAYSGQPRIEVTMEESATEISQVVVTGYYEVDQSSYTGAARTIRVEELRRGGNQNLLSMLRNIDPSFVQLDDNYAGSDPNAIPDFQMRGTASIGGLRENFKGNPNMPVFIVDGFESTAEKVFDMDPHRVSTITLLKDASATAIYGSRAANGVVVITTALPKQGRIAVNYSADATFYMADLSGYNLCNSEQKLAVERLAGMYDATKKSYYTQSLSADQIQMEEAYSWRRANMLKGIDTYWLDKPLNSLTVAHKHNLTVDGGNDNLLYALNVTYNDTPGVMKESGRTRFGISLKIQYMYKNLTFRNELSYSNISSKNSPYGEFSTYTKMNSYVRHKDDDGNYIYELEKEDRNRGSEDRIYNPLFNTTLDMVDKSRYNDITDLFGIDWRITDGLRVRGSFSFTVQNRSRDKFKPAGHTDFADWTGDDFLRRGTYDASRGETFSYDGNVVMTYFKQTGRHTFNANAGWNIREASNKEFSVVAEGFPNDNLDYISFATQYQKNGSPRGDEYTSRLLGFLGNFNYSYDDRFLADFSLRADASSQFGADRRWAPFWSAGAGYNIHNEKFMENARRVDRLKLRATYGLTGSQDYDPYQAMTMYRYLNTERYQNTIGTEVIAMGNPGLAWQRTFQWNFGLDVSLWNRLELTADYYIRTSKDVLTAVTLPPSLGFESIIDNLGEVENRGWEVNLRATLIRNSSFFWNVNASAIHNRNRLLKISNALRAYNDSQDAETSEGDKSKGANRPRVRYIEGASMNSIWVNRSLGVDPATGREIFRAANGDIVSDWSSSNYVIGGCTDPDLEGTFGSHISWKGLEVSVIFRYRIGGQIYNQTLVDKVQDAEPRYNVDRRAHEDRWQKPGDKVRFTAFIIDPYSHSINTGQVTKPTSRFVEDYNFLNLATLNISYDFGLGGLERAGVKRLRAYAYFNDLFHLSNVKRERGIDYPFARNFSVGLQLSF